MMKVIALKDEVKTKDEEIKSLKDELKTKNNELIVLKGLSNQATKEDLNKYLELLQNEYHDIYTTRLLTEPRSEVQPCLDELMLKIKETVRRIDKIILEEVGGQERKEMVEQSAKVDTGFQRTRRSQREQPAK